MVDKIKNISFVNLINNDVHYIIDGANYRMNLSDNQIEAMLEHFFGSITFENIVNEHDFIFDDLIVGLENKIKSIDKFVFAGHIDIRKSRETGLQKNDQTIVANQELIISLINILVSIKITLATNKFCPLYLSKEVDDILNKITQNEKISFGNDKINQMFIENINSSDIKKTTTVFGVIKIISKLNEMYAKLAKELSIHFKSSIKQNEQKYFISIAVIFLKRLLTLSINIIENNSIAANQHQITLLKRKMNSYDWFKDKCFSSNDQLIRDASETYFTQLEGYFNVSSMKLDKYYNIFNKHFGINTFDSSFEPTRYWQVRDNKWFINRLKAFAEISEYFAYFEDEKFIKKCPFVLEGIYEELLMSIKIMNFKNPENVSEINIIFSTLLYWAREESSIHKNAISIISKLVKYIIQNLVFNNVWDLGNHDNTNGSFLDIFIEKTDKNDDDSINKFNERKQKTISFALSRFTRMNNSFRIGTRKATNLGIVSRLSENIYQTGPLATFQRILISLKYLNYSNRKYFDSVYDLNYKKEWNIEHLYSQSKNTHTELINNIGNKFLIQKELNEELDSNDIFCNNDVNCMLSNDDGVILKKCKQHIAKKYIKSITNQYSILVTSDLISTSENWNEKSVVHREKEIFDQFNKIFMFDIKD